MNRKRVAKWLKIVLLLFLLILIIFPIYWIFIASITPSESFLSVDLSWLVPKKITFKHYLDILGSRNYRIYYGNSLVIATVTTVLTLVVATLGGYSLGRLRFRGRNALSQMVLVTYLVPSILLLIPLFQFITKFHMQDSYLGLILSYMTFALPFCLWMLKGFFAGLPENMEDAALIDGTGVFGAFLRIILPLASPGLISAAMFTFLLCWNEYLFAMVFINNDSLRTIPVGVVSNFVTVTMGPSDWSRVMASAILASLPIYIIFIGLQKYFVAGLAAGSIKE